MRIYFTAIFSFSIFVVLFPIFVALRVLLGFGVKAGVSVSHTPYYKYISIVKYFSKLGSSVSKCSVSAL